MADAPDASIEQDEYQPVATAIEVTLDEFFARGLIRAVLGVVKSGKEATVYRCQAGPAAGEGVELLAAKVYRPLERRAFRNDAVYAAGRTVGDRRRRDRLAFQQKSRHGREVQFSGWVGAEFDVLTRLAAAGVDTPRPYRRAGSAILMAYVGDAAGPAPTLSQVAVPRAAAGALLDRLLANVARCLAQHCVHGDLSAYNILYWEGVPWLIDFPQAVDPRFNPNAYTLLERDVVNVCRAFGRYGVERDGQRIAAGLWARYARGDLGDLW
jgi:RIO kinase 1